MRIAYADPPYVGCANLYPEKREVDHVALIARLVDEFPDGWGLSCHTPSLRQLLPLCPEGVRVGAWVKPFAAFKPNVTPAYAWEPVLFMGGRRRSREEWSGRDWVSAMPPVFSGEARGIPGMKPESFCYWLFVDLFGLEPDDELVDVFPGSGAVGRTWERYRRQGKLFTSERQRAGV